MVIPRCRRRPRDPNLQPFVFLLEIAENLTNCRSQYTLHMCLCLLDFFFTFFCCCLLVLFSFLCLLFADHCTCLLSRARTKNTQERNSTHSQAPWIAQRKLCCPALTPMGRRGERGRHAVGTEKNTGKVLDKIVNIAC